MSGTEAWSGAEAPDELAPGYEHGAQGWAQPGVTREEEEAHVAGGREAPSAGPARIVTPSAPTRIRDVAELRARRWRARRNRRLARIDVGVGVALALLLLLLAPGLAIAALIASLALVATVGSVILGRLRRRREARACAGRPARRAQERAAPRRRSG